MLNDNYWSERYKNNQSRWDIGQVAPALKAYFDQLPDKNISILIPGCGNAYEAEYLLKQGFTSVTLADISLKTLPNTSLIISKVAFVVSFIKIFLSIGEVTI